MKRTFAAFAAVILAFTAVSCGKKEEKASDEETAVETTAEASAQDIDELLTEKTTTAEELEQELKKLKKSALERVNMTAQSIPEYEIPDDWHEISDGRIKMLVPSDVTDQSSENSSIVMGKFLNEDRSVSVITMESNDWSDKEEETDESENYFPEISEENIAAAFNTLGIEYDGTRTSFYKAVLSFTGADRTKENADAFEIAALAKGFCFFAFPEVFYIDANGHDIYAHGYPPEGLTGEKFPESNSARFWVGAFADSNTEYTLMVKGKTREEALMMCSTIEIVG